MKTEKNIIFASKTGSIMTDIKQLTLSHMQQMVADRDHIEIDHYISQGLAMVRKANVRLMLKSFDTEPVNLSSEPVVLKEMRVLILKQGSAHPILNLQQRHLEAGALIFAGANSILKTGNISEDAVGMGILLSDELFTLAMGHRIPKAFNGHLRDFNLQLKPEELDMLDHILELIYRSTQSESHQAQVTLSLVSAFIWYIDDIWSRHEDSNRKSLSREQRLFSDFIQLVNQYAHKEHQIDFYADRLFLSPRYMSTLVKKVSGKAAKEWIDEAITTRIKVELKHSDKSIAQIAYDLNFPNPSFFSKYFKRMTGMTPHEYITLNS